VSNPATSKDLAARTWGVFWYSSKIPILFETMVQINPKRGTGVKTPSLKSFWCGLKGRWNIAYTKYMQVSAEALQHVQANGETLEES